MNNAPPGTVAYALRNVSKRFGPVYACHDIDLEFFHGETIGLAGENGAGKSTSMKCLAGWMVPSAGHIEVDGQPVRFGAPRDAELAGIAVIPQELDLFPELPVYENIHGNLKWPRTRTGTFDRRQVREAARNVLSLLGVSLDVNVQVKELSPANQKLVQIARAINLDARLLIMDEPTAALTELESDRLFHVINDLRAQGRTIVHITHKLDEIFDHCDRVAVLRDGELVAQGAISEFDAATLILHMVGRKVSRLYERRISVPRGPAMLQVEHLSKPGVFSDISFTLHGGEILGLAGLIGAGRSELAHALVGFDPAETGRIKVKGEPQTFLHVRQSMEKSIGYLPEERRSQGLHLPYSVSWNTSFAHLEKFVRGGFVSRRAEHEFAARSAREFGVKTASLDMEVSLLSGGNQQKVLLAKVLAGEPEIVILDEPTRGVDVGAKSEIYALIEQLVADGKAVLLISSEMEELIALADRVAVMFEGRLTAIYDKPDINQETIGSAASGQMTHVQ